MEVDACGLRGGLNEAEVRDAVIKAIGRAQKAMTASPASLPGKAIG